MAKGFGKFLKYCTGFTLSHKYSSMVIMYGQCAIFSNCAVYMSVNITVHNYMKIYCIVNIVPIM